MKANEAPERIYCESDGLGNIVKVHNIKWPDDEAENIEYVCADAFMKKAENFLEMLGYGFTITDNITHTNYDKEQLIDDFRKYIEGE